MKEKFGRWNILLLQYLKRDFKKIIIWVLGLGLFAGGFIPAFEEIAKGDGLLGMFETLQNPAMIAMIGPTPAKTASDYSLGGMYSHMMLLYSGLFAMVISILHVIGHTRKEEDQGLTELVRSFQVGRQTNSLAVIGEIILINSLLAVFIGLLMIGLGGDTISAEGSILYGVSIGLAGILGAVIALLMAQLMPVSSAATGSSLGILGILYIIRGGTDVYNIKLSMINPLGWTYLTYPFTENNLLPIIIALTFSIIVIILAFGLEGRRDMGAGYLAEKEGRANAKKNLLSVEGLIFRLNKGLIIGWLIAFLILGAAYGSIYGDMQSFVESNELMKQMFSYGGVTVEESFTATLMVVLLGLVTIVPIAIVNKLFSEEKNQYLSQIFGTRVSRGQLYWTSILLAVLVSIVGVFLSTFGLGATAISVMENPSMDLGKFIAIGYNLFPSLLFFTSLAALALGWAPGLGKIIYIYLSYSFLLSYFAGILNFPKWLLKTIPQFWLGKMPVEDFNIKTFLMISIISIVFMMIGYLGYKKRDMMEGA